MLLITSPVTQPTIAFSNLRQALGSPVRLQSELGRQDAVLKAESDTS